MSTLQIINEKNSAVELSFSKLTQICGCNIYLKNYAMRYISKYFSKKKYNEDELEIYSGDYPKVLIDGEVVSRSRYDCIHITSVEDIEHELMFLKDSALYKYILSSFQTVDISANINTIDDAILKIANSFESNINFKTDLFNNIKIQPTPIDKEIILKNFVSANVTNNGLYLNYMTGFQKLNLYLQLQQELSKTDPNLKLVLISNIEKIIKKEEVQRFDDLVRNLLECNVHFIVESSTKEYILGTASDIENINILSNINASMPNIHTLTDTINRNYPTNKIFSEQKVYNIFKRIANNLFDSKYTYSYTEDDVILKILNSFYDVNCTHNESITLSEKIFLKSSEI